jgi:hypothetical protein
MMVVVIISLLIAITIPLIGDLVTQSRRSATKTTITKLHEILQKRMDAFERGLPEYFRSVIGRQYEPANADHVMIRKRLFQDLFWNNAAIEIEAGSFSNAGASEAKSAAVLYLLVTRMEFFGTAAEDAGQFNAAEIGEVQINGNTHKVFIDSWGNPIVYYPYATRLIKPAGAGTDPDRATARYLYRSLPAKPTDTNKPDPLNEDQDDPFDVLTANYNPPPATQPPLNAQLQFTETNFHTFRTYHTPLILSAGPDGSFEPSTGVVSGLGLQQRSTSPGHLANPNGNIEELYDNISNHNIKAGDQ